MRNLYCLIRPSPRKTSPAKTIGKVQAFLQNVPKQRRQYLNVKQGYELFRYKLLAASR